MRDFWFCLGLVVLTAAVYANSFPGAFHYDDFALLLENPGVTGPNFRYASFLDHYGGRPLTLLGFHWNYRLAGPEPFSYHLINVILHLTATLGVYLLAKQTTQKRLLSLLTALIFGLHPLQTQPVNYIWSRSMLLMACFGLASAILIRRRPWPALLCFQAAIWSRTEAVVFFAVLSLLQPSRWKSLALVAGANIAAFMVGMMEVGPREMGWNHSDVWGYWLAQPAVFWAYVKLMVWPAGLHIDHDFPDPGWGSAALGAAALLGAVVLVVRWRRSLPIPFHALVWMLIMFAPTGLIPNSDLLNESRVYLVLAGFALAIGWLVTSAESIWNRRYLAPMVTVLLVALMAPATLQRNRLWNSDVEIWRDAAAKSPDKDRVRYNLGFALARQGRLEAAKAEFERARQLNPRDDLSYAALGYCAEVEENWRLARDLYQRAIELNPDNAYAREGISRLEMRRD